MNPPGHSLLIRLKSIGDVLFTLPAVNMLRANFPESKLTFLTNKSCAPILKGFSQIDEVITIDRDIYRGKNLRAVCGTTLRLVQRLRREKFSLAIDFHGFGETALLTWLTGAPQRWGSVYKKTRRIAYTTGVYRTKPAHPIDWNRFILTECGLAPTPLENRFELPADSLHEAEEIFSRFECSREKQTVFIQPFTSDPAKDWPLEKYLDFARNARQQGAQVIFGGAGFERQRLSPAVAAGFPVSAGTQLLTTAGLMELSTLVIGGDTGLLHLAVALGKRVLMLMSANGQASAVPYGHPEWSLVPNAGGKLADIELRDLMNASNQALLELAQPSGNFDVQARQIV